MKIKDLPIELYTRICDEVPERGEHFDNYDVEFKPTGHEETGAIEVRIWDYESGMAPLTTLSPDEPIYELARKLISKPRKDSKFVYEVIDSKHNRENHSDLIGDILDNPPGDIEVKKIVDLRAKKQAVSNMDFVDPDEENYTETDEKDIQQKEAHGGHDTDLPDLPSYGPEDLEESFTDDNPIEGDYVMYDSGPLGAKTSVGVVEGDFLGEFNSEDTAMEAIFDEQRKNNWYSNIWKMDDHGGYTRVDYPDDSVEDKEKHNPAPGSEYIEGKKQAAFDYELHNWNTQDAYNLYSSFMDYLTETSPDDYDKKTLQEWYSKILKTQDKEDKNTLKEAWSQELGEWKKESSKKQAVLEGGGQAIWDALPEADRKEQLKEIGVLKPEISKKEWLELPPITRQRLEEKFKTKPTALEVGKRYDVQTPKGRKEFNLTSIEGNVATLMDDAEKKFTVPVATLESGLTKGQVKEAYMDQDIKEYCPNCKIPLRNIGKDGAIQLRDCPKCSKRISTLVENPYKNEKQADELGKKYFLNVSFQVVTEESAAEGDFAESGFKDEGLEFDSLVEMARYIKNQGGDESGGSGWWSTSDEEIDYQTGESTTYGFHPMGLDKDEMAELERYMKMSPRELPQLEDELYEEGHEASKKTALELWKTPKDYAGAEWEDYYVGPGQHRDSDVLERANFIAALEMLGGEHDPDVIVARAGHFAVGWVESILVHKDSDKVPVLAEIEKKIDDYPVLDEELYSEMEYEGYEEDYQSWAKHEAIKGLELEEQEDGSLIDPDGLIIYEDDLHTIVVDLLSEGYSTSDTRQLTEKFNEVAKPIEQIQKKELEEGGQQKLPLEGKKKQANMYFIKGDIVKFKKDSPYYRPGYFRVDVENTEDRTPEPVWVGTLDSNEGGYVDEEELESVFSNEDTDYIDPDSLKSKKDVEQALDRLLDHYESEDMERDGASKKADISEQSIKHLIDEAVHYLNQYTPEFTDFTDDDIVFYVAQQLEDKMGKALDVNEMAHIEQMVKSAASKEEVIEEMKTKLDKFYKEDPKREKYIRKVKEKYPTEKKESAANHMRYCTTCGKKAGVMSDKAWKDKLDMCSGCYKDYERNEKPRKKPETAEDIIETEVKGDKKEADIGVNYGGRFVYEIKPEDVGKTTIKIEGRPRTVADFFGRIMKQDIGKHIYDFRGTLQVESQDQLKKRLNKKESAKDILEVVFKDESGKVTGRLSTEQFMKGVEAPKNMSVAEAIKKHNERTKEKAELVPTNKEAKSSVDPHAARELKLYIENDGDLHRQMVEPIRKNLVKKIEKGIFDFDRSIQAWMNLADYAAHKYIVDFGSPGDNIKTMFSKATRWETAKELAEAFKAEADLGNYDHLLEKSPNPNKEMEKPSILNADKKLAVTCFCGNPPAQGMENEEHPVCDEHLKDVEKAKDDLLKDWPKESSKKKADEGDEEPTMPEVGDFEKDPRDMIEGDEDEEKKEALAKFLGISSEEVVYEGHDFEAEGGEYSVYTDEEADRVVFERVKEDLESDPSMFNQDWLQRFIYIDDTTKRVMVSEEEDSLREMVEDDAGDEEFESEEEKESWIDSRLSERLQDFRDGLDNPIQYFVEEQGLYSAEDLMKQNWISIEINEAVEDAVNTDGRGHFLGAYSGDEDEVEVNGTYYYIYRTN